MSETRYPELLNLLAQRESCRKYLDQAVEPDRLERVIDFARIAPSACNAQPWFFHVVTEPELRSQVAKALNRAGINGFAHHCPAFIVITEEQARLAEVIEAKLPSQHYAAYDIGLATANICYAALAEGLGTCIMGWFDEPALQQALGLAAEKRIALVIAIGYPGYSGPRQRKRKVLQDVASFDYEKQEQSEEEADA